MKMEDIESVESWNEFQRRQARAFDASLRRCREMIMDGYESIAIQERFGQTMERNAWAAMTAEERLSATAMRTFGDPTRRTKGLGRIINKVREEAANDNGDATDNQSAA